MEIMKLIPTGKDYLWGGTRLREEYGKEIDLTPLAETWECSVHPDGPSYVANGTYKGKTLAEVLKAHSEYLGTKVENGELPVLVKFIDAKKDLSVQVHPSDEYAREHEGDNGKTEMWYVIDADEGASLIYGFQHEVTEKILRRQLKQEHWISTCKSSSPQGRYLLCSGGDCARYWQGYFGSRNSGKLQCNLPCLRL